MTGNREHTKRIARNTLMLYIRMFFMMVLGLFTSRIVLESLGEDARSTPRSMSALERTPQVQAPTPHKVLGPGIDGRGIPRGP